MHIFEEDPHMSIRRASNATGLSFGNVQGILKSEKCHPYKMQVVQELMESDYDARVKFCHSQLQKINEDPAFLDNLLFTDEAHFHLHGVLNKQNYRCWAYSNPHFSVDAPLHSPRTTAWIAFGKCGTVGPFFFEGNVTSNSYLEMLQHQFLPAAAQLPNFQDLVLMQDGAPPHWALSVRNFLEETFPARWMGRGSPYYAWPPRSPDLTPVDYFFWGDLKRRVYTHNAFESIQILQQKIVEEVNHMPLEHLIRAVDNYPCRLQKCIDRNGGSVEIR
jgi:hypothetical protein